MPIFSRDVARAVSGFIYPLPLSKNPFLQYLQELVQVMGPSILENCAFEIADEGVKRDRPDVVEWVLRTYRIPANLDENYLLKTAVIRDALRSIDWLMERVDPSLPDNMPLRLSFVMGNVSAAERLVRSPKVRAMARENIENIQHLVSNSRHFDKVIEMIYTRKK